MLSILIVLHELGHFVLARGNGVRVNEFSVGFGPRLIGWTSPRSGTQYSLRALPIGGFCAMEGEDNRVSEAEQQREFRSQRDAEDSFQAKPALPIGGFSAMEGEDNRVSDAEQQREFRSQHDIAENNFQAKSPWRRLAIILAGPV